MNPKKNKFYLSDEKYFDKAKELAEESEKLTGYDITLQIDYLKHPLAKDYLKFKNPFAK